MGKEKQLKYDSAYLKMAETWGQLSYCERKKVGALIVKDRMIISDGYNGTPSGFENICEDENHYTKWYVLHAEANAIVNAARRGHSTMGSWLAVTRAPCLNCAKMIHHAGVERVYISTTIKHLIGDGVTHLVNHQVEVKLWSSMKT